MHFSLSATVRFPAKAISFSPPLRSDLWVPLLLLSTPPPAWGLLHPTFSSTFTQKGSGNRVGPQQLCRVRVPWLSGTRSTTGPRDGSRWLMGDGWRVMGVGWCCQSTCCSSVASMREFCQLLFGCCCFCWWWWRLTDRISKWLGTDRWVVVKWVLLGSTGWCRPDLLIGLEVFGSWVELGNCKFSIWTASVRF